MGMVRGYWTHLLLKGGSDRDLSWVIGVVIEIRRARSERNAAKVLFFCTHLFPFFFFVISYI